MHTDCLSLPDRSAFLQSLDASLNDDTDSAMLAVIVLKIQRLKEVGIEFGYMESDLVNEEFVKRLRECLRDKDYLARINVDEFAIFLPGIKSQAQPVMAITKIQRLCCAPMEINGQRIHMKLVFGSACSPGDAVAAESMLRCADVALLEAERSHVDAVRYSDCETVEPVPAYQLETELESAIETGALRPFYQPIVDVETGELASVELLIRWPDNPFGDTGSSILIDAAERSGLIMPLTIWCINNGLRECSEWQSALPNVPVSINFSNLVLTDPHLLEVVISALNLWNANVGQLTIEVTESAIMSDPDTVLGILNQFHERGVNIAIDDFGTGYSSLAYLKELPIDILKIDQSFVANMIENLADRRIVQTVIDLAHNFDLTVVAEGVENEETLDTLTLMGCQRAQGFHVGQPMPSNELSAWFESSDWELMASAATA